MKKIYLALIALFCCFVFANQTFATEIPTLYRTQTTFQKNYETLGKYFKAFNDCRAKNNLPKLRSSYILVKENQVNANNLVIFKIKKLKGEYLKCKEILCPTVNPPICDDGTLVAQGKDSKGCQLPPKCVATEKQIESGKDYLTVLTPTNFLMKKNQGINQFNSDTADFSITFKLKAGAKTIYIKDDESGSPGLVLKSDNGTSTAYACSAYDGATRDSANHLFVIQPGTSGIIECSIHISPDADGHHIGYLSDFIWGTESDNATEFHWTPEGAGNTARMDILQNYKSDPIYLDKRP